MSRPLQFTTGNLTYTIGEHRWRGGLVMRNWQNNKLISLHRICMDKECFKLKNSQQRNAILFASTKLAAVTSVYSSNTLTSRRRFSNSNIRFITSPAHITWHSAPFTLDWISDVGSYIWLKVLCSWTRSLNNKTIYLRQLQVLEPTEKTLTTSDILIVPWFPDQRLYCCTSQRIYCLLAWFEDMPKRSIV